MATYTKEEREKINNERFLKHILTTTCIPDEETAFSYFSTLPMQYKNILTIRYGLDGSHKTSSDHVLIKKAKDENAVILYKKAEEALKMQVFAKMLLPLFMFEYAAALGLIATRALYGRAGEKVFVKNVYDGKKLLDLIEYLDDSQYQVLCLRYGLDGLEMKTFEEVGKLCCLTSSRVEQIEKEALQTIKAMRKMFDTRCKKTKTYYGE